MLKNLFPSFNITFLLVVLLVLFSCKETNNRKELTSKQYSDKKLNPTPPSGMIWIDEKVFLQGAKAGDVYAMHREKPSHFVKVDSFFIDITEVTNKQFKDFVDATGYITVAERPINWEEIKKQVPKGTPKPHDSLLQPGSLIFNKNVNAVVNMQNYGQWWTWKVGANWKHPQGPDSSIEGQDDYPVVHVTYEDALAYCEWANRRLPTEAEWEAAAQGKSSDAIFTWGNEAEQLSKKANTWQGRFPILNESIDGFEYISPVKSFEPNSIGLYDMTGNVWEITSDLFNVNYYREINTTDTLQNPKGSSISYNPDNPYQKEYVIKGGSFLCHASYCASFRISARMGMSLDSSSDHTGFRTVATPEMLND
jgi:formylglycine-generating enzyme required for sulfatase activity